MTYSEADTRSKLIDPAIYARGWTEDHIKREETAGPISIVDGTAHKQPKGRVDYTLRLRINHSTQPVAVALIEAKAEHLPPTPWAGAGQELRTPAERALHLDGGSFRTLNVVEVARSIPGAWMICVLDQVTDRTGGRNGWW